MGKQKGKGGGNSKKKHGDNDVLWVDPAMIRFQHSKIRPYFSSCGRALTDTLDSIRRGDLAATDLPPIQVLIGPETNDGQNWYFSLNNRRLWVLKRCREENLLTSSHNLIPVRVRPPKSAAEAQRYTLDNCAVEAKVMREAPSRRKLPHDSVEASTPPPTRTDEGDDATEKTAKADVTADATVIESTPPTEQLP